MILYQIISLNTSNMCTLTYLPQTKQNFILTSSRDESPLRPAALWPNWYSLKGKKLFFPKDGLAKGTWIGYAKPRIISLLNGGFERHKHQPPYRMSRGLVVRDGLLADSSTAFLEDYPLDGIEPFTLLLLEVLPTLSFRELVWDGQQRHLRALDPTQPHIWSSSPLYDASMRATRRNWFDTWRATHATDSADAIWAFHHEGGEGDPKTAIKMRRAQVRTRSLTQFEKRESTLHFRYEDLEEHRACKTRWEI